MDFLQRGLSSTLDYVVSLVFGPTSPEAVAAREETDPKMLKEMMLDPKVQLAFTKIMTYEPYKFYPPLSAGDYQQNTKLRHVPEAIIQTLKNSIKRLEGPISCIILKPTDMLKRILQREAPVLLLLGDWHEGNIGCYPVCDPSTSCFKLGDSGKPSPFLKKLNDLMVDYCQADFYLEAWLHEARHETRDIRYLSWNYDAHMNWLLSSLKADISSKTLRSALPGVRIHSSDTRQKQIDADKVFELIFTSKNYDDFCSELYKVFGLLLNMIRTSCEDILKLAEKRIRLGALEFFRSTDYRDSSFFQEFHAVLRQIKQLPKELQNVFFTKFELYTTQLDDPCDRPFPLLSLLQENDHQSRYEELKTYLTTYVENYKNIKKVTFIGWNTLELFYLARSFKSPFNGWPSQLSVAYFGNWHMQNILYFVLKSNLYTLDYISYQPADPVDELSPEELSKCVKIDSSMDALQSLFAVLLSIITYRKSKDTLHVLMDAQPELVRQALIQYQELIKESYVLKLLREQHGIPDIYAYLLVDVYNKREAFEWLKISILKKYYEYKPQLVKDLQDKFYPQRKAYFTLLPLKKDGTVDEKVLELLMKEPSSVDILLQLVVEQSLDVTPDNYDFAKNEGKVPTNYVDSKQTEMNGVSFREIVTKLLELTKNLRSIEEEPVEKSGPIRRKRSGKKTRVVAPLQLRKQKDEPKGELTNEEIQRLKKLGLWQVYKTYGPGK